MDNKNKTWEKQDYESAISFSHFQKYYLLQPAPRTVTKAYRQFQVERGLKTPQQIKKMQASGAWNDWAKARYKNGDRIPDSKSWFERAEAYDASLFLVKEEDYKKARHDLLQKEVEDVNDQLRLWEEISMSFTLHVKRQKNEADNTGDTFNPAQFVNKGKEIWKWRDEIAAFQRRTINMPAVIKEKPVDKNDNKTAKIKWEEPKWDDKDVGVGSGELKEDIDDKDGLE